MWVKRQTVVQRTDGIRQITVCCPCLPLYTHHTWRGAIASVANMTQSFADIFLAVAFVSLHSWSKHNKARLCWIEMKELLLAVSLYPENRWTVYNFCLSCSLCTVRRTISTMDDTSCDETLLFSCDTKVFINKEYLKDIRFVHR